MAGHKKKKKARTRGPSVVDESKTMYFKVITREGERGHQVEKMDPVFHYVWRKEQKFTIPRTAHHFRSYYRGVNLRTPASFEVWDHTGVIETLTYTFVLRNGDIRARREGTTACVIL